MQSTEEDSNKKDEEQDLKKKLEDKSPPKEPNNKKIKVEMDNVCKICQMQLEDTQACLKHELLEHTNDRMRPKKSFRNKINSLMKVYQDEDFETLRANIHEALSKCVPGQELLTICKSYTMDREQLDMVCERILSSLKAELSGNFKIHPFGSIVSGLALKDCDIDLYLEHVNTYKNGAIFTPKQIFNRVYNVLQRSNNFDTVIAIRQARVPIIKCQHTATGFSLDINTSSESSIANTTFLRDLVLFDNRLYELMIFFKAWAKQLQLVGRGNMTSYCLTVLIIFYLQHKSLLMSIKKLQETCPPYPIIGVNYAYDLKHVKAWPEDLTVLQLVKGFIDFYARFDFEHMLIAPFLGLAMSVEDFLDATFAYDDYEDQLYDVTLESDAEPETLQTDRCVCIQDPFCLTLNIAKSITPTNLAYFRQCIRYAQNICNAADDKPPGEIFENLLFGVVEKIAKIVTLQQNTTAMRNTIKNLESNKPQDAPQPISSVCLIPKRAELRALSAYISQHYKMLQTPDATTYHFWVEYYLVAIKEILTDIYCMDVQIASPKHSDKHKRLECSSLSYTWHISASVDMWTGRAHQRNNTQTFMNYQRDQTKRFQLERRQNADYAVQLNGDLGFKIERNEKAMELTIAPTGGNGERIDSSTLTRQHPLHKFFAMFKTSLQNFNLKEKLI